MAGGRALCGLDQILSPLTSHLASRDPQGVDLDVLGDVVQLLLEIISTVLVQNIAVRASVTRPTPWLVEMIAWPTLTVPWASCGGPQSNLRLLYVLMYEQDALDQLRDKYRFAPLLVNIDTVPSGQSRGR